MLKKFKREYIALAILIIFVIGILFFYFRTPHTNNLKIAFLDIGQGDSIYIEAPNGAQMIVDGGRGGKVLKELSRVMPFGDRTIDVVIATHPDADHIGGLLDVLDYYDVATVVESGAISQSKVFQNLETKIENEKSERMLGRAGMQIVLDEEKGVYFEILYPDVRDVSHWDTNDTSIVGKLVYGNTSVLLTGDSPLEKELYLARKNPQILDVDILKLGHHGSRTSTSVGFLRATTPELAIISAGKDNQYGHPHKDVLDRILALHIPYLATYDTGTILCTSDAVNISCK